MSSSLPDPAVSTFADEVGWAYRWILGREPDPQGQGFYAEQMASGALTRVGLRDALMNSPEFQGQARRRQLIDLIDGVKVVVDPADGDIGYAIDYHKAWDPQLTALLRERLGEGDVFVDIGANVGVMSFVAASVVGAAGRVIAFEPNPTNAANFRRGLAANGFDNVLLHNLAVSDRAATLSISANSNAKASDMVDPTAADEVVQAVALDAFLAHEPRIDALKIDIEGYELRALIGMDRLLRRHRPLMLIEYNPLCLRHQGGVDARELADLLFDLAGRPIDIVEVDGALMPIGSAGALIEEWERRNRKAVEMGWLPDGWAHLDLLLRVA